MDLQSGSLHRNGLRIRLQGKPLQILTVLLEHADEVVTREELQQRLWPEGTFVDFEHGLNTAVKKLRGALNDDPDHPRYVQTVPRKGYRFIGATQRVVPLAPLSPNVGTSRRPFLAISVFALVLAALAVVFIMRSGFVSPPSRIQSLAVLPFVNLSHDLEQEYFADGMTDELTSRLAKISVLRVISWASAMQYKGVRKPLPQIARELGVDAVIEGTVTRSGDRVRVRAQLVSARNATHIWAESYDRQVRDALTLQSDLARDIGRAVQAKLTPEENTRLAGRSEIDPDAQDAYLKGRFFWHKLSGDGCEKGVMYFRQAIERNPHFAAAYASLALCYVNLTVFGPLPAEEAFPKAKEAATRAVALDGSLAEGHTALGAVLLHYDWDWRAAEQEFKRSIDLNTNDPLAYILYAADLIVMGKDSEAVDSLQKARLLDPVSQTTNIAIAFQFYLARKHNLAIDQLHKIVEMYPDLVFAHSYLAENDYCLGLSRQAGDEWLRGMAGYPKDDVEGARRAFNQSGMPGVYSLTAQQLVRDSATNRIKTSAIAQYYAAANQKDLALMYLGKAYRERDDGMLYLKVDPHFDNLHGDPRYVDLCRRVGLP